MKGIAAGLILLALLRAPLAQPYGSYTHVVRCSGAGEPGRLVPVVGAYCYYFVSKMALFGAEIPRTSIPLREWTDDGSSVTLVDNATGAAATVAVKFESEVYSLPNSTAIWSYGQLLQMINTALAGAHEAVGLAGAAIAVRFDPITKLFSFVVPNLYVGRVTLYTRWTVTRLFGSFGKNLPVAVNYPSASPLEFMYAFPATVATDGAKSVYTQEISSLGAWSDLVEIEVVLSDQPSGVAVLTDYSPLSDAFDRGPYKYRGPNIWTYPQSAGTSISLYYTFAEGSGAGVRRPIVLREGDYWSVSLGY